MKFAFVSYYLPPTWGGQTIMVYRLLQSVKPDDYCLISRQNYDMDESEGNYSRRLPAKYYHLPPDAQITRGYRFGLSKVRETLNIPRAVLSRAGRIAEIVRQENCRAIVACTGEVLDLPAAYLASRMVGVPFYAYLFDYYSYQSLDPKERFFARRFEPIFLKGAAGIIVPNEFLRDELKERYGVEATVIYNPCDISEYERLPGHDFNSDGGEIRLVYTGAIYEAHFDAFRNLIAAINMLGRPDVKLHLYSASPVNWKHEGIYGPVVGHGHQEMSAIPRIQREADILFLPLAFESPYPTLIKTSATSKMGEYLAARQPTLVHAPRESFVAWYFRHHQCGLVVDKSDPAQLAQGIEQILNDASLRQRFSANAWERARSDYSVEVSQAKFAELLGV